MASELIETLLQAHRSGDLEKLEECWLEMVESIPPDIHPLMDILKELNEWGESGRALAMVEMLVPTLRKDERWQDLLQVLQLIIALNPGAENVGPDFASCLKNLNPDCPTIDLFIEKSRLRFARPVGPALKTMEVFLRYRPEEVVLHESGWGIGIIQGFDPLDAMLIVDFHDKKGHKINPAAAPKLLKKLEPDDFRALKVLNPEKLTEMIKQDPVGLLRLVLIARNGKGTASKIKAALVPDVISAGSWSSWWSKTKRAVEKEPLIQCVGTGATATFSTRTDPVDPVKEALHTFKTTSSYLKRSQLALDVKRGPRAKEVLPALIEAIHALPPEGLAARAEVHFLLESLGVENPGRLDISSLEDPEQAIEVLTGIEHPHLRKRAFEAIREVPIPDRGQFLKDAFFKVSLDLLDLAFEDLESLGDAGDAVQSEIISTLVLHPRTHPDRFGWLVSHILKGDIQSSQLPDPLGLLRKLLDAINHLYRHFSGKKDYRERLLRMQSALSEKSGGLLGRVLDQCSSEEASRVRDLIFSCLAFSENYKRELGITIARRHTLHRSAEEARQIPESSADVVISSDIIWTTSQGLKSRKAAYEKLVNIDIPKGQEALTQAASFGDLSDNAELTYARDQQGQMTKRAETMEADLKKVRIIDADTVPEDKMGIGSRGTFKIMDTGEIHTYTILGPWDSDPDNGILPYDSPLARQLLDHIPGDVFEVKLPGQDMELALIEVEKALDILQ